jgi:hypothetical protein
MTNNMSEAVEILLEIMDMGSKPRTYGQEREWLFNKLYKTVEADDPDIRKFSQDWYYTIKNKWVYESEYFHIRNAIRTEAKLLVFKLAADEIAKLEARRSELKTELKTVEQRLSRFNAW